MLKLKRLACAALAAVMLTSAVSLSGCSTPEIAMTVDGTEYSTGVYLAYLYNTYFSLFYQEATHCIITPIRKGPVGAEAALWGRQN